MLHTLLIFKKRPSCLGRLRLPRWSILSANYRGTLSEWNFHGVHFPSVRPAQQALRSAQPSLSTFNRAPALRRTSN